MIKATYTLRTKSLQLSKILSNTKDYASFDQNYHDIFGKIPKVITCYKRAKNLGDLLCSSKYKFNITQLNNNNNL